MGEIRSYRDLEVWQLAMRASRSVYLLTRELPPEELFGLTGQMRRAMVSVPSNIAEGHAQSTANFRRHLAVAMGSLAELETQLLLTSELYPRTSQQVEQLMEELGVLGRKIRTLSQRIEQRI